MKKKGLLGTGNIFKNYQAISTTDWREEQYTLNLSNINYTVSERVGVWWQGACFRKIRRKKVLRDVTTQFKSGEITAILGSSGSGKTSLLDIIAHRSDGEVKGKITLNSYECDKDFIKQTTAYVIQADRLLHTLTVRETLQYAAFLRLPGKTTAQERDYKVDKVIQEMGLKPVANSKIGGTIDRGVSGGERRRVTIAIQLLHDPDILLLDEPTTGLDSFTARHLVKSLANIAHKGKMVILTVHQPRSDIFKLLDKVCILSNGDLVYFGACNELVDYFREVGYPCPTYANPLDHYVDISSVDRRSIVSEHETSVRVEKLVSDYRDSTIFNDIKQAVDQNIEKIHKNERLMQQQNTTTAPNAARVLGTLMRRMFVHTGRDRAIYSSRIFLLIFFTPFIFLFLWQMDTSQSSIQNRVGLIYQASSVPPYIAIMNAFAIFPPLRDSFYRESMDGLYSIPTFVLAYSLYIIPFQAVSTFIFSLIVYWTTGMYNSWGAFGVFTGVLCLLHFMYEILTIGTMGALSDPRIGQSTATLMLTFSQLLSSGLIRRMDNMFDFLQWLSYAWPHKYSAEILMYNELSDIKFSGCDGNTRLYVHPTAKVICGREKLGKKEKPAEGCQFPTGQAFLDIYYPHAEDNYMFNIGVLSGGFLLYFILTTVTYKLRGIRNLH